MTRRWFWSWDRLTGVTVNYQGLGLFTWVWHHDKPWYRGRLEPNLD